MSAGAPECSQRFLEVLVFLAVVFAFAAAFGLGGSAHCSSCFAEPKKSSGGTYLGSRVLLAMTAARRALPVIRSRLFASSAGKDFEALATASSRVFSLPVGERVVAPRSGRKRVLTQSRPACDPTGARRP